MEPAKAIDAAADISPIVVFDADCVLCSGLVAFMLAHERDARTRFAAAGSREGLALAARHGFSKADLDETFLVIEGGAAFSRSGAAIRLARRLKAPWRWLAALALIPRPARDAAYAFVAARRYRWFGRRGDCVVVPPDQRARFLGLGDPLA
jgi:predicted DCC family thiol-disulfide oxidoreductase YuxK